MEMQSQAPSSDTQSVDGVVIAPRPDGRVAIIMQSALFGGARAHARRPNRDYLGDRAAALSRKLHPA